MTDSQYYEYGSGGEVPMSKRETGGPAFPASPVVGSNGDLLRPADIGCEGMTLRDYFAAKAMAAIISADHKFEAKDELVALWAYKQADAMLAARDKT